MCAYTLMLASSSTIAYATVFTVLFDTSRTISIVIGGTVVLLYSAIGGMWSITLTDMVQFTLKTIGVFLLLLPFSWHRSGGFAGIRERAGEAALNLGTIGTSTIITFFVVYTLGILIGQDIWQRVFTARSPGVAKWSGTAAGVYCLLYGIAGALIGSSASTFLPGIAAKDDVYAQIAETILPVGVSGVVLAAAVAAMMSTASGALIATATVAKTDVRPILLRVIGRRPETTPKDEHEVHSDRMYVLILGIVVIVIAASLNDVVAALTVAYDILVGGLFVAILGGFVSRRGTSAGAVWSMAVGTVVTLATMVIVGDVMANEPIYYGLGASLTTYIIASALSGSASPTNMRAWDDRRAGVGHVPSAN